MKHKKFIYRCPVCGESGLEPDANAVYKVRVCSACAGKGKAKWTVPERLVLDTKIQASRRLPTFDEEGIRREPEAACL